MLNEVKLIGRFLGAGKIKEVGNNKMKVRDFWIDLSNSPDYPNTPELSLSGDKCSMADNLTKGMEIEVLGYLNGNKFTDKEGKERVFTNVRVSRINIIQRQSTASNSNPVAAPMATGGYTVPPVTNPVVPSAIDSALSGGDDDKLPF